MKSGPPGLQIPLLSGINVIGLSQLPGALKTAKVTKHARMHTHTQNKGEIWVSLWFVYV